MALFDKAWAVKTGGSFVLRIEDTDQNRLVEGSEQQIHDTLEWLGLGPDEAREVTSAPTGSRSVSMPTGPLWSS